MKRSIVIGALAMSLSACGGESGPIQLSSQAAYQDFFWSYCLPFAEVLTELADGSSTLRAVGAPVACPGGGTAVYDDVTGVATLTDCAGVGAVVNGTVNLAQLQSGSANITGGSLSITGSFAGTATIDSGVMSWELPVADATTYWELRMTLAGSPVCIWSGAESGPCPSPF